MFELYRAHNGRADLQQQFRDFDRARQTAASLSRIHDGVFWIERGGHGRPLVFAFRGTVHTDGRGVVIAMSGTVPPVLRMEPSVPVESEPEEDDMPDDNLDNLTVAELREIAERLGLDLPSRTLKDNLIAAIREAMPGPDETPQPRPREYKGRGDKRDREYKQFPATITEIDEEQGIVTAIVSVFGIEDDGGDIIHAGAFTKTLAENGHRVRVLNSHFSLDVLSVVGKPISIREIGRDELPAAVLARYPEATGGLETVTKYLIDTPEGAGVFARIKAGAIDEYSIGFDTMQSDISHIDTPDADPYPVRNIRQVRLWEFSPVVWGMNSATTTVNVKDLTDVVRSWGATPAGTTNGTYVWATTTTGDGVPVLNLPDHLTKEAARSLRELLVEAVEQLNGMVDDSEPVAPTPNEGTDGTAAEDALAVEADTKPHAEPNDGPHEKPETAPTSTEEVGPQGDDAPDNAELVSKIDQFLAELEDINNEL
jgi:hypothetical protein